MYELQQVGDHSYYVQSPAKIGLIRTNETDVCLIDSGSDKDAGRRVRKLLDEHGWRLTAIYQTHSHADHIGGNQYLQKQTGCQIYAPGLECDFTNRPVLEPMFLYGGYPMKDLRHKFLMAQESRAEPLTQEALPDGLRLLSLPGHSFEMVGFRTEDDVVFLADCLSSKETLDKYQIGFLYDVAAYLQTLDLVQNLEAKFFVPSHAEVTSDVRALAQYNIDKVWEVADKIVTICQEPATTEKVLQALFEDYHLQMNFEQYVLIGSTVRSYLSWLKDTARLEARFVNNELLWNA